MGFIEDLPIMPLNSVLFPGAPTTLYIYEQRYRRMLQTVMDGEGYFGVGLLRAGKEVGGPGIPHDIGTIAQIVEATKLADGTTILLAQGGPRFEIDVIMSTMPVFRADVRILEEDGAPPDGRLPIVEANRELLHELMRLVLETIGAEDTDLRVPDDPNALSWAVAANLQTPLATQQQLLETRSVIERLELSLPLLRKEIEHYRVMTAAREKLERLGFIDDHDEIPFSRN